MTASAEPAHRADPRKSWPSSDTQPRDGATVRKGPGRAAQAARALGIPVIGTEQNPAGLGHNVEQIRNECSATLAKLHLDACADGLVQVLHDARPEARHVVIAGCEAHVCMMQTALGLLRSGRRVWVVANASGARRPSDHAAAMGRLAQAGATLVTHEMVLFEWLGACTHPRFRHVLRLIKQAG